MNFIQKLGTSSPATVVGKLHKNLEGLDKLRGVKDLTETVKKEKEKYQEGIKKQLDVIKEMLANTATSEADMVALHHAIIQTPNLVASLINSLPSFAFESKKDVATILSHMVRRANTKYDAATSDASNNFVSFLMQNTGIIDNLIDKYNHDATDVALNSGNLLREVIRNQDLAKYVLEKQYHFFFNVTNEAGFDKLSDTFSTFKDLLTRHKVMVSVFLKENYDEFMKLFNEKLINSENYVTKRQSIRLISELLLDRIHFDTMTRYVSDSDNLKNVMRLLCEDSKAIKYEAFHVFKIFVANPNKTEKVLKMLVRNKDELVKFLDEFHVENRENDEQFNDERHYLIKQIKELPTTVPTSAAPSTTKVESDETSGSAV